MASIALLTGSPGGVLAAVSGALASAGWEIHQVALAPDGDAPAPPVPRADAVVHIGVRTPRDLEEDARVRVEAGAALGAAALARRVSAGRLVHVSTAAVYGRPRNLPCREGEIKEPRTAYERIRWQAEQASWSAFRRGAPLTVLRPTLLYGPGLRGGPVRALALVALFNQRKRRVPILRRGPVAHLVHVEDLGRAALQVLASSDREVVGRAFNVGDEAPLPLAEHLASALSALGYQPGRVLPAWPRLYAFLLWLFRNVPDRALLDPVNRRFHRGWRRVTSEQGGAAGLWPRVEREALHWMSADHYYDVSRLRSLGWQAAHPVSTDALPGVVRALVSGGLLPDRAEGGPSAR